MELSSSPKPNGTGILVATMVLDESELPPEVAIAFLMGQRLEGPEKGTWFFPNDELKRSETVEDCVRRILKQVGKAPHQNSRIVDTIAARPILSMQDTYPEDAEEDRCGLTTVFVYCPLTDDEHREEEPAKKKRKTDQGSIAASEDPQQAQKMDQLAYVNWIDIEDMCAGTGTDKVAFSALSNFLGKWPSVHCKWEKNPWDIYAYA